MLLTVIFQSFSKNKKQGYSLKVFQIFPEIPLERPIPFSVSSEKMFLLSGGSRGGAQGTCPSPPPPLFKVKKKKKLQKEEKQQGEQNKTWTPPPAYGVDPPPFLYKWKASQIITAHLNRNTDWNNHNRKGLCLFNIIFSFIVLHSMGSNQKVVYMQMQMV